MSLFSRDPKPVDAEAQATGYPTIDELKSGAHPDNPRTINAKQRRALEDSMARYGDLSGIVFNRRTGHIVCGHQRLALMPEDALPVITTEWPKPNGVNTTAVGYISDLVERWPYRVVDVAPDVEEEMMIAANAHGGEWNLDLLEDRLAIAAETTAVGAGSSLERQLRARKRARESKAEDTKPKGTSKVVHKCPECGHTWSS